MAPLPDSHGAPALDGVDHVHVFVADRAGALGWYAAVLGLRPVPALEFWARDGGPLTLADAGGNVHIALFEAPAQACRSTIALRVTAVGFIAWQRHLAEQLGQVPAADDHGVTWSLYFTDPDGNPYEITTDEHAALAALLRGPA